MRKPFTILLTFCILMIIGVALIPRLDISNKPLPRQGKTLEISFQWQGASERVVEQNVTSRIEGVVSSVGGVKGVSSESYSGSGKVWLELKPEASVSGVRFEVASLLRQVKDKLPEGVSYPELKGGEVVVGNGDNAAEPILTYRLSGRMTDDEVRKRAEDWLKPKLEPMEGVGRVDVHGGAGHYVEISYDAEQVSLYGITSGDMENAIRSFVGRHDVVGDIVRNGTSGDGERTTLFLAVDGSKVPLGAIPVNTIGGKVVYLNNLATMRLRDKEPMTYFRVNGQNTIYMNVYAAEGSSAWGVASAVRSVVDNAVATDQALSCELTYDKAEEELAEFRTLMLRSGMALLLLLGFVFLCRRNVKYLVLISVTLLANLLLAVIFYVLLNVRLEPFSMAGITVSLGIVIDSVIVMVDHYSYRHDTKAFFAIACASITTIGSLVVVFWLPDFIKDNMLGFSLVIMVNIFVAMVVSLFFAPALVDRMGYSSRKHGKPKNLGLILAWNKWYGKYISLSQRRFVRFGLLALFAVLFGWSLKLFVDTIKLNSFTPEPEAKKLHIWGKMPMGGTPCQLNQKVEIVEAFLANQKGVRRFETSIDNWGADIVVEFCPESLNTNVPYEVENKVVGKLITIGGADWTTWGVSERGFSNSLNLQYRSTRIMLSGYEFARLHRYAEDMAGRLAEVSRVRDIAIEVPGHEQQADELCMRYRTDLMSRDSILATDVHRALADILGECCFYTLNADGTHTDYVLRPVQRDSLDLWQLGNSFVNVGGRSVRISDYMSIDTRKGKECIPRKNQEYVLQVAFNVLGSSSYTRRLLKTITDEFNAKLPVGFRCADGTNPDRKDDGMQYWLVGVVVVVIFFVCSIMFESLRAALSIVLLIPVSMTGLFLAFHFLGMEFGNGGFAAMVMLCGLTVNNGIYLMAELRGSHRYQQAYNHKIVPILLTVASTILGLLPFLVDGDDDRFWFTFAVGSISGLLCSLVAIVFAMPMLVRLGRK